MDLLFLLGRIIFGGYFVMNGYNHLTKSGMMAGYAASKNVPSPQAAVLLTGAQLVLGGLSIALGVYTQLGSWLLILFVVPVAFVMHRFWEEKDENAKMMQMILFMRNMALAGALLMISTIQSWPLSIQLPY